MKEFGSEKIIFDKMTGVRRIIGHTRADQLLPQLSMERFDTFPIQCRHIEHMHEGVWFRKIIFDKMTGVRTIFP